LEKSKKCLSQSEAWAAMMDIKSLCKVITLLEDYYRTISSKSGDFTGSSFGEVENVLANQRPEQPSWISNHFKKIQNFCRTPRGTFVVSLVTWHAVVMKKLKM
jgi:hypothetical protein